MIIVLPTRLQQNQVMYTHCAGLDVHKKSVVVCCLTPGAAGEIVSEIRTFGTMTHDLLALSDWLTSKRITHVAMEATAEFTPPTMLLSAYSPLISWLRSLVTVCNGTWGGAATRP